MKPRFLGSLSALILATSVGFAQFAGFVNKGLVAVGRVPADAFDKAGNGHQDTLGGFSAMAVDTRSLIYAEGRIAGRLVGLPDRGFGDGATDYHPRLEWFDFTITPYYGQGPVAQEQIVLVNSATVLFRYGPKETLFTGFDAGNTNAPRVPQSPAGSIGGGRRSMDAEGIVLAADGGYWIGDEYGPALFRFDAQARLLETILPPAALLPTQGAYPGSLNFTGNAVPASGRRNNRGLEGLSLTPDGKRLVALLQSPTIQDGGAGYLGRNTRILQFDADPASSTYGKVLTEHIYQLTLNGSAATDRHTPVSEVLALNPTTFLVLERDGIGRGGEAGLSPAYKRVVLASTAGASNIAGSGYDLEKGAPGQLSLPSTGTTLPTGLSAVARQDFVDLLDTAQLAKFGLNTRTNQDANSLGEKWEALSLVPLKDPANPDDYLLLVGNDNDFKAGVVYHNGVPVGTNAVAVDLMVLAYRVTLPGVGIPRLANVAPAVEVAVPGGNEYAQASLPLAARVYDADGIVVKAEFFEDGVKLGEKNAFPWVWGLTKPTLGGHAYRVVVTDNSGAVSEAAKAVSIVSGNLAPSIAITAPADATSVQAPCTIAFNVKASDTDGFVKSVDYYDGAIKLGVSTHEPFSMGFGNTPLGRHVLTAVATDNLGLTTTSAPVSLNVVRAVGGALTLQVLHASDFETGSAALDDIPRFSSVLNALRAEYPGATLVLASGDNSFPGPVHTASADPGALFHGVRGRADIAILNAFGVQASCFGNHGFEDNAAHVRSVLLPDAAAGYPGSAFPYLVSNLSFATDKDMVSLVTTDGQDASTVRNTIARSAIATIAGEKIGLVGGAANGLPSVPSPEGGSVPPNLVADIQAAVDGLLARGVNKVILLNQQQQSGREFELARQLRDVDIIIAGGSRRIFARPADRLRPWDFAASPYPTILVSASGEPVYLVNTGANYRYVGRLRSSFDESGKLTGFDQRSGAYATDLRGVLDTGNAAPAASVLEVVNKLAGRAGR